MPYIFPIHTRNHDQTYGPTARDHFYLPAQYHGRTARRSENKTRWHIKESEQYEVFRVADEAIWKCTANQCLFSIIDNGNIMLGENGERLGKFPIPANPAESWHGFPFPSDEIERGGSFYDLLDKWENDGIITSNVRRKIVKGVI